ncbi:MAG: hypothetical protein ABJB16_06995 [Saprospiraceae bacterium]
MNKNQYSEDLAHIRSMMERSSRFISLSGWAGILPGIFALAGLALAVRFIQTSTSNGMYEDGIHGEIQLMNRLGLIAFGVLALSVFSSWYMCMRKARMENQATWTPAIRNMLLHFCIPLVAGAIIAAWVTDREQWSLIAPILLSFYGLALIQVSQFTLKSIFWLGLIEIALSLPAGVNGWGIPALAIGFGFAHIVYGVMQFAPKSAKGDSFEAGL